MTRFVARITAVLAAMVLAVPASADDVKIANEIIGKLQQQQQKSNLQGFDLGVQVDKGTVTMMGRVASTEQAVLALDIARRVPGVKLVVNDLSTEEQLSESQTTPSVETASANVVAASPAAEVQPETATLTTNFGVTGATAAVNRLPVAYAPSTSIRQASAPTRPVAVAPVEYVVGGYTGDVALNGGFAGAQMDNPAMPAYAWPSYAAHPNYGAVAYPQQYSAKAWPFIGPFYPYPQVPLGWRKVTLEWDDGWWFLDFRAK